MNIVDEAIIFAVKAHEGQTRKMSGIPYILHPIEVVSIIGTMTSELETMAAGALHDTVEDCGISPEEIRERFGSRVYALVQSETEDKMLDIPKEASWLDRKKDSLLVLSNTKDLQVKILWLGDKLSNIRSFYREYLKHGDEIWKKLNQKDKKMHEWYYRTIAENMTELSDTAAYQEYIRLLGELFNG